MSSAAAPLQPEDALTAPARQTLIVLGRELAALGMLPATSGNLSLRIAPGRALMTCSGCDKGLLGMDDFLLGEIAAAPPAGASAEAPLHLALYRQFADAACVLHVHSRASAVLSRLALAAAQSELRLQGWELQKAIAGQVSHEAVLALPVFANDQDTARLADAVAARLAGAVQPYAYLLAGHGLYAWGRDAAEARRHVVALDVLLQSELDLRNAA
ncbi:MAG: methylthioribulose 1-phosphate dehydratase [Pseudomonadota bacterium]|nr:methylthioribulose 1-phosphate dehydratase [Pseudomonadota bacterium]